jgi:molybdenum cofactor biosynthesis enzyme MoaA
MLKLKTPRPPLATPVVIAWESVPLLTTNGLLLRRDAEARRRAGLRRVTVSLDTLDPLRARDFARVDRHSDILEHARGAGRVSVKLNTVVMRGYNDESRLAPRLRSPPA